MRSNLFFVTMLLLAGSAAYAQKDMKAPIQAANQKFMDAFAKGATTMGSLYTSDAELMPPGSETVTGNAAIGTFWKGAFDSGVKRAKLETLEATQGGDQVTEVGHYTLYGAGDVQMDAGKYVVVWKKEGGNWKLHRDIWNTSAPAAMATK